MPEWSRYLKNARKQRIFAFKHLRLGFWAHWGWTEAVGKLACQKYMKPSPWRWFWNNVRVNYDTPALVPIYELVWNVKVDILTLNSLQE
jgi:hypothetical protein